MIEWVAHRGESADAPENTMSAYKLAWERGVAAAELDVHLTKDGQLILTHDADTSRTAGQKLIVKDSTVEELQKLDVGSWKSPKYAGEKMPLLEDVVRTIPDGRRLFIEVKIGAEAVPELVRVLNKVGKKPEQTPVISFKLDTCIAAKKALPKVKVYYLAAQKKDKQTGKWSPSNEELIALAKQHGFDGLDLAYKGPIDADFVKSAKAAGLDVLVWTVDEPADARRMIEAGVDAITSNHPAWLSQQVK
ncbi:glycerophosphodiester phosphodiesterase [Humisphaera borealis]|uniref:Glycerophosphodiester phosphodiesterase n=2 Tax=Humisphaera borealis TaxID=2807512 RepID=A0A7M2X458_9BACT|nr:glycerophosphodiester phosphodiesterase [Humisphaera borealis]